ncbi:PAS domain-containing protein [Pseudomonas aeruginosa]|nr:PAS domain-containing protein [Pseudomonas aeruginosa]
MSLLQRWQAGWARLASVLRRQRSDSLDQLPLALVRLDADGCMSQLNLGWEALTGYRAGECLQRSHAQFLHIEDRPLWLQGLQELRGTPAAPPFVQVLRYLTRAGELRWVEARVRRQGSGFIASLGDISSQMLLRQSLQARHRSLSNLLDGLPLMVYRCRNTRHWSMEYVSAGCLALTGYSPEQLIDSQSLTFNSLIHPDDREDVWRAVQLGVDELQVFSIEYRLLCSDGSEKRVLERGCGIYSDAGDPLGLEGVVLERL